MAAEHIEKHVCSVYDELLRTYVKFHNFNSVTTLAYIFLLGKMCCTTFICMFGNTETLALGMDLE